MAPSSWKRLPLSNRESCPPLLFKYDTGPKGYEILLTDLAHVWSENLNHKQILQRASREESSIDPSQDEDQYSVLLQKVGDALRGSKGSTVSLLENRQGKSINLVTTTILPGPLEPLSWTIYFSKLPQNALTKHILLPVLQRESQHEARMRSLVERLKEKDKVLGKLFDKIDTSGVDLSIVFPGMAGARPGRKGSLFSQASKVVKGVSPFDEGTWNTEMSGESSDINIVSNIAQELSNGSSSFDFQSFESVSDDWWFNIPSSDDEPSSHKQVSQKSAQQTIEEDTSQSEDEFQRQETPPRFKSASHEAVDDDIEPTPPPTKSRREDKRPSPSPKPARKSKTIGAIGKSKRSKPVQGADDTTESEESEPPTKPKSKPKGLGTIGGKKSKQATAKSQKSPDSTSSAGELTEPVKEFGADDDATTSDDGEAPPPKRKVIPAEEENDISEDEDLKARSKQPKPTKSRAHGGGFGQIGGKKRFQSSDKDGKESTPPVAQDGDKQIQHPPNQKQDNNKQPSTTPPPPKRIAKLGMIGGGSKASTSRKPPTPTETPQLDTDKSSALSPTQHKTVTRKKYAPMTEADIETESEGEKGEQAKASKSPKRSRSPSTTSASRRSAWPKEEPTPAKEETPEERANRKREELRRQLETRTKGAGGPVKKKRKF